MKYLIMLADGMADFPVDALNGKTPMMVAKKPCMDAMAKDGAVGLVRTVPDGMHPGSDVANLAVLGYDPHEYYTGRSPLEAISMGIPLTENDVAYRCNLVSLSENEPYEEKTMVDHSGGEITTEEARLIIADVQKLLHTEDRNFFPGVSYRHCLVWENGPKIEFKAPYEIPGQVVGQYLPANEEIIDMMKRSFALLKDHPVNVARKEKGLLPANSIWLWGQGTKPSISSFEAAHHLKGTMISAVDLLKGIGLAAGMESIDVEGATGNIHTNFAGKGIAALEAFKKGSDLVYIHCEAPDECGHQGDLEGKIRSIELIDGKILAPVTAGLTEMGEDYTVLVMPDHPTPVALQSHTPDPIPFLIYRSNAPVSSGVAAFDEDSAKSTGLFVEKGYELIDMFLK